MGSRLFLRKEFLKEALRASSPMPQLVDDMSASAADDDEYEE